MSLLNSGKIHLLYGDNPYEFESPHTAVQMFPATDTGMWRVEVWDFEPEDGYTRKHHVLIDAVNVDSPYSKIRSYIHSWILSNYDKVFIFKELSK